MKKPTTLITALASPEKMSTAASMAGCIFSYIATACCCICPTAVLHLPERVWAVASIMPWNCPPSCVAWAMAAATSSVLMPPLLITSCSSS